MKVVVAKVSEFADGDRRILDVDGRSVGVFRVGDNFYAIRNRCPHQFGPLCLGTIYQRPWSNEPGDFRLDAGSPPFIRCPWHGWEYDLSTGQSFLGPGTHLGAARTYAVDVEHGRDIEQDAVRATPPSQAEGRIPGPYVAETVTVYVEEDYVVIED